MLTKRSEWMEPKHRPNFKKRNPYKAETTSFERPLEIGPTETDNSYPTDPLRDDHYLGQSSQEPQLGPSQAPERPPTPSQLPNPRENKPSKLIKPRTRKTNISKPQASAKAQRQDEARDKMKAKEQITWQKKKGAENNEKTAMEMEAMLAQDIVEE